MDFEILKSNFRTVYQLLVKREGADKLLEWLDGQDFYTAPASTKYHGSYAGGLCEHSIHVYNRLSDLHNMINPDERQYSLETIAICGLLHDICKVDFYKETTRNVKNETTGAWEKQPYFTVEDQLPYGHGEKSVYIINGFIRLTRAKRPSLSAGTWAVLTKP